MEPGWYELVSIGRWTTKSYGGGQKEIDCNTNSRCSFDGGHYFASITLRVLANTYRGATRVVNLVAPQMNELLPKNLKCPQMVQ